MKMIHIIAIALLVIVPMSLIFISYSNNQLKTIKYQIAYDQKLKNSTLDAIKAFQTNMSNSSTSDLANSKLRDIEASVNVFYSSLVNNFYANGFSKESLRNYVPAIVYTLYDGYYIYSAYDNVLTNVDVESKPETQYSAGEKYEDGERIYGLKPYIYYSCRYKPNNDSDFVITYSLDSYITIQGMLDGKPINKSGYLLTGADFNGNDITYRGVTIEKEKGDLLQENVYIDDYNDKKVDENNTTVIKHNPGQCIKAPHIKYDGTKYYLTLDDENTDMYKYNAGHIFHMLNDERLDTPPPSEVTDEKIRDNEQAQQYYKEAAEFKEFILDNTVLMDLKASDAVDINGEKFSDENSSPFTPDIDIFQELWNLGTDYKYIEDKNSDFYLHRTEVIKNAIESNLMVAIDNFNKVSSSSNQFAMPKLTDKDWDSLTNGVSMITFLQGLSIGGKVYNGYSVVNNDKTEDYIGEDSIYIVVGDTYYSPTDKTLKNLELGNAIGVLNTNFEKKTINDTVTKDTESGDSINSLEEIDYFPRNENAAYTSIINPGDLNNSKVTTSELMKKYLLSGTAEQQTIAKIFYTALGRERQAMYRINR